MVIDMNETQLKTVAQLRAFLNATLTVEFQPRGKDDQREGSDLESCISRLEFPIRSKYLRNVDANSGQPCRDKRL